MKKNILIASFILSTLFLFSQPKEQLIIFLGKDIISTDFQTNTLPKVKNFADSNSIALITVSYTHLTLPTTSRV